MIRLYLAIVVIIMCIGVLGCAGTNSGDAYAEMVNYSAGRRDVLIYKKMWEGVFGIHGYVGFQNESYEAELLGDGPSFVNPKFVDNPPDNRCIGVIILDLEHNQVVVNMRRIVSREGQTERTIPHPANGTYKIKLTRKASPVEHGLR